MPYLFSVDATPWVCPGSETAMLSVTVISRDGLGLEGLGGSQHVAAVHHEGGYSGYDLEEVPSHLGVDGADGS